MSNITGTVRASIQVPTTPVIYNISVPLANTEMSQALVGVKKVLIRARGASRTRFAFDPGDSSVKWITIAPGAVYSVDQIDFTGTIYFQTSKGSEVVEVLAWA